jgi:arsenate reductase
MAEGFAKALRGNEFEVYSAGIETHGLNQNAVKVMSEAGIDITSHKSENISNLLDLDIDVVYTVCGHAHETCPVFPGNAKIIHTPFPDPPALAAELKKQGKSEEEQLEPYRKVRDMIKDFIISI